MPSRPASPASPASSLLVSPPQLIHDQVMFGPVIEPAFPNGVGPRLEVHGLGTIKNHAYSAPYEDLRLGVK